MNKKFEEMCRWLQEEFIDECSTISAAGSMISINTRPAVSKFRQKFEELGLSKALEPWNFQAEHPLESELEWSPKTFLIVDTSGGFSMAVAFHDENYEGEITTHVETVGEDCAVDMEEVLLWMEVPEIPDISKSITKTQ